MPGPHDRSPLNSQQQCALYGVQLNQKKSDVQTAQALVDACNPQGAQTRILQENTEYVTQKRAKFNELVQANTNSTTLYYNVRDAVAPIVSIGSDFNQQTSKLQDENSRYVQAQRKERRNFLDADPLSGISGIPFIKTSDDKVLLAFWITLYIALAAVLVYLFNTFAPTMSTNKKLLYGAMSLYAIYGIVYYLITQYG